MRGIKRGVLVARTSRSRRYLVTWPRDNGQLITCFDFLLEMRKLWELLWNFSDWDKEEEEIWRKGRKKEQMERKTERTEKLNNEQR